MKMLPLRYVPSVIKSLVLVSIAAVAVALEQLDTWKEDGQSTNIQELLYKELLLGKKIVNIF